MLYVNVTANCGEVRSNLKVQCITKGRGLFLKFIDASNNLLQGIARIFKALPNSADASSTQKFTARENI